MPASPPPATTPTPSLIPPETAARVGERVAGPVTATITAEGAQRYAQAVGDLNPIYFDLEAARSAGYDGLVVPPTYVPYALVQGRPLGEIAVDGLFVGERPLRLDVGRVMFGGEEWDFAAPVLAGDVITAETVLSAIDQKDGSKGPFVRITRETTYTRQEGAGPTVVIRTRQIGIAR